MSIRFACIDWKREWRTREQIEALQRAQAAAAQKRHDEQVEREWRERVRLNEARRSVARFLDSVPVWLRRQAE